MTTSWSIGNAESIWRAVSWNPARNLSGASKRRRIFFYDPVTKTGGYPHVIPYTVYKQGLNEYTGQVLTQQLAKIGVRIELRLAAAQLHRGGSYRMVVRATDAAGHSTTLRLAFRVA